MVDVSYLNFDVLTPIPKVPSVDCIKQFRPIALIKGICKIITKAYAIRLSLVAHRVIQLSQYAFIKGRNILDGVLSLHEIILETIIRKFGAFFSNSTSKKRMIESTELSPGNPFA